MSTWEIFEDECTAYLNKKFGKYATFAHKGGSDSTTPDILATTANGIRFYIEVKQAHAQCGQFVLLPDTAQSKFIYSSKNITPLNPYAEVIIAYMDKNFDRFKNAGTKGEKINISNGKYIFTDWIISTYKQKNVRFFMTENHLLLPIDYLGDYFDTTAAYRIKRSGSSNAGKNNFSMLVKHLQDGSYTIESIRDSNSKLFVKSSTALNHEIFTADGYEYMFSKRENEYEIRRLSNTFNANVIFSIKLKAGKTGISQDAFVNYLTNICH